MSKNASRSLRRICSAGWMRMACRRPLCCRSFRPRRFGIQYQPNTFSPRRHRIVIADSILRDRPRTLATHLAQQSEVVDMLRRYIDAGAKGFGEHKPQLAIDDPNSMRLYEACAAGRAFPYCSIWTIKQILTCRDCRAWPRTEGISQTCDDRPRQGLVGIDFRRVTTGRSACRLIHAAP